MHNQPIRFDGDGWKTFVPIRLPGTVCVRERLPAGAAAVLINRAHTQTDIYLPIDKQQERLFDDVDNERSVGEIVREHGDMETARDFFELLWRHDQIVFNASQLTRQQPEQHERT